MVHIFMLKDIISEAGYESRSYSGRAMYGKECVGFSTDDDHIRTTVKLLRAARLYLNETFSSTTRREEELGKIEDFLEYDLCVDQLGRGLIYYFRRVTWED
jgi:hypothetical protein